MAVHILFTSHTTLYTSYLGMITKVFLKMYTVRGSDWFKNYNIL